MRLKPVIASYSGESFRNIRQYLNENVLEVIARISQSPVSPSEVSADMLRELVEMHVLAEQGDQVRLETAVFLERDIERIRDTLLPLAIELAQLIKDCGSGLQRAAPEVTVFLGGIIGLVQGTGRSFSLKSIGVDWKNYPGKYAQSKVDFDEICDAYEAAGQDYLNKTVLQGERFTAVFIGPGGTNFTSMIQGMDQPDLRRRYASHLNRYLVDAFAMLLSGEIQSENLLASAEAANLYKGGKIHSAVITDAILQEYVAAVQAIISSAIDYYEGKLSMLVELACSTTSGKQGAPPANMMMHLWRYIRKAVAQELYANGFFRDSIPQDGCLTVFYANNVQLLRQLLL